VQKQSGSAALLVRVDALPESTQDETDARLTRMFDTMADPSAVRRGLSRDPLLAPMIRRYPGIRVPGAWDPFEIVVRAVVGQQVSVGAARTILGRIAERACSGRQITFPSAEEVAATDVRGLGMPDRRADTVRAVACAVADGSVDLSGGPESRRQLLSLAGIGPWTVEYVAMRAFRDADAFPHGDLVLRRAAGNGSVLTARELEAASQGWRPWRAYATILLWKTSSGGQA
jgi:AraC family transcriptional regulator of adaptative response / DNA-3-methyladenine glycosylase II